MIHSTKASPDNDSLIVDEGPMTWSRMKRIKEAILTTCSSHNGRNIDLGKQINKFHVGFGGRNTMDQLGSSNGQKK